MGKIRLSERVMRGEDVGFHPFTPQFESKKVTERTAFVSGFANVLALSTEEGLVLVDVGSFFFAKLSKKLVRRVFSDRLHTAIYTHSHVGHIFGVELYEAEDRGPCESSRSERCLLASSATSSPPATKHASTRDTSR